MDIENSMRPDSSSSSDEDSSLLVEASKRLKDGESTLSESEVMKMLGISEKDIEAAENVVIE